MFNKKKIQPDEVHVCLAHLPDWQSLHDELRSALSAAELERGSRFLFDHHRARFVLSHGLLRRLISSYTGQNPSEIAYGYSSHGKPFLEKFGEPLHFNMSHSHDAAAYAFSSDCPVGIDIEKIDPRGSIENLVETVLTENEQSLYASLEPSKRLSFFYQLWTCKEALLKASGEGLSVPMREMEISGLPDGQACIASICGSKEAARKWSVNMLNSFPGYACAVVVNKNHAKIKFIR